MKLDELFHLLRYEPHAGQLKFHASDARFKVLIAGARFGKSLASAKESLGEMIAGPSRGWLVGPTYALTRPEFDYIRDDTLVGFDSQVVETSNPAKLSTSWGAEIVALSAHAPEGLLGSEIDWLILCEAAHIEREAFERFLRARLTTRSGRLIIPTTPRGRNWIQDLYNLGQSDEPGWDSFRHASWDNPNINPAEIESARRSLPQETFDEQFGGAFTSPAGRVYREFAPSLHVAKLLPPPGAIIYKAMDFGYVNPFACLWGALDNDGRLLVLCEYYRAGATIADHARVLHAIDRVFLDKGCQIGPGYADPSGALERKTLGDAGVRTQPADNRLRGGIDIVRQRLLPGEDGMPGLRIDESCANLLREFELYEWDTAATNGETVPRKQDDHALDALRYLCVALAHKVSWRSRELSW